MPHVFLIDIVYLRKSDLCSWPHGKLWRACLSEQLIATGDHVSNSTFYSYSKPLWEINRVRNQSRRN